MNILLASNALIAVSQQDIYLYLQLVGVFTLLALLIQRELISNIQTPFARAMWRVSIIGIVPLLIAFLLIMSWHLSQAA